MTADSSPFFALRAPLFPFELVLLWGVGLRAPDTTTTDTLADQLAADVARLRGAYGVLLDDPVVREALFIASPDLDQALAHWHSNPDSDRGQAAERALTRYFTRMASRPTPFGLFGSTSVGTLGEITALEVSTTAACRRHTRLDMDYLVLLVEALTKRPDLRAHLSYHPATSLYRTAGGWRYVETQLVDKTRSHRLVSLDASDALDATIDRARGGATRAELAAALVEPDVTEEEARAFIDELIDSQVLEPDLACPVTGPEPHAVVSARLEQIPDATDIARVLRDVERELTAIDAAPLGVSVERYRAVASRLEALPAKVDLSRLFQSDLTRPPGATLSAEAMAAIARGVDLLHRLQAPEESDLDRLRRAWSERYEGRPVPLLEALDSDSGLGTVLGGGDRGSSALLDGLDFPGPSRTTIGWGERERRLFDLVGRAVQAGAHEIVLSEDDLKALEFTARRPLPAAYSAMATLVGDGEGPTRVLMHGIVGPSGARLLGRFCHADDTLRAHVEAHLRDEEAHDPDAVFAEIVHLPEGRVGNVILRPALRPHEIAFMGASMADADHQIRLDEITVQLVDGRFVLRSDRLGRRVIPRLSCAHNYAGRAVGVYRFLCLVQADSVASGAAWDWGALSALPMLPRVRVGDVVLTRAQWRMTKADIAAITRKDRVSRFTAVREWRASRRLPRWVVLSDYDNLLPVDLDNVLAVESFVHLVKERDEATLTELYPGPDELVAHGPDGGYTHEIVVPFVRPVERPLSIAAPTVKMRAARPVVTTTPRAITRSFAPGSEWVFAKLYGGTGVADRVITDTLAPLSRRLLARGVIDRWFFIRYADPDEHVRWRLHVSRRGSRAKIRGVVESAMQTLHAEGLVRRATFDTYEREIERYGGPAAMLAAEHWFWTDSECTVDVLNALASTPSLPDDRWRAGVLGVDRLLTDMGLDLQGKASVLTRVRESFGREFSVDASFRRALADKLRPHERALSTLLESGPEPGTSLEGVAAALDTRHRRSRAPMRLLRALSRREALTVRVEELADSYVHMTLNRLFRSEARMHELVLYDFLAQIYQRRTRRMASIRGDGRSVYHS